ncbi:MAG: HAD family hydrolase [Deltaproteobacteria bacterium]|nr:HAD family hydrolase [Deltaproteobacteria bacterium]MBI2210556.1 HAD family hydrolase [Deltaproteobacteria bacterium]
MTAIAGKRRGVLVDRDGTLIREVGYLSRVEQIEILPGVPEAIELLRRSGLKVAVVTNQSAVARGFITEGELREIHRELERQLAGHGASVDGIYYCPHHPTEGVDRYRIACGCRKPNAGMARRAAAELDLDIGRSYVIGDQAVDMEMASRIGAKGIFLCDDPDRNRPDGAASGFPACRDLWEAARWVVGDLELK